MSGWARRHLELDASCTAGCGQTSELQPRRWRIQELLEHWLEDIICPSLFLAEKPSEQSRCSSLESLSPELLLLDLRPSQEQCVLGFITRSPTQEDPADPGPIPSAGRMHAQGTTGNPFVCGHNRRICREVISDLRGRCVHTL